MQEVIYLGYSKILVANTGEDSLTLRDMENNNISQKISLKTLVEDGESLGPDHMDIGRDGLLYIVNSYDDSLVKIDLEKTRVVDLIKVGRYPTCIKIFKGKIYVLNRDSNSMSIIDEEDFDLVENISLGEGPSDIEVDSEGFRIFIANRNSRSINILNLASDEMSSINLDEEPIKIIIENNRLFVLSNINKGNINYSNLSELEIDSQDPIMTIKLKGLFLDMIKIRDREVFYMINIDDGYLYRVSLEKKERIKKTYLGGMPSSIIWDGKDILYITNSLNNSLSLVAEDDQRIISNIRVGKEPNRVLLL